MSKSACFLALFRNSHFPNFLMIHCYALFQHYVPEQPYLCRDIFIMLCWLKNNLIFMLIIYLVVIKSVSHEDWIWIFIPKFHLEFSVTFTCQKMPCPKIEASLMVYGLQLINLLWKWLWKTQFFSTTIMSSAHSCLVKLFCLMAGLLYSVSKEDTHLIAHHDQWAEHFAGHISYSCTRFGDIVHSHMDDLI